MSEKVPSPLPCPWCGNEVRVERDSIYVGGKLEWESFHIKHQCEFFGRMVSRNRPTKAACVEKWNERLGGRS